MDQRGRQESLHVDDVEFLAEQDGVPERELKEALRPVLLGHAPAKRAYLAVIRYSGDPDHHVALCLASELNSDVKTLVRECADVFVSLFRSDIHLDTILVNGVQELRLKNVCWPFFDRDKENVQV